MPKSTKGTARFKCENCKCVRRKPCTCTKKGGAKEEKKEE